MDSHPRWSGTPSGGRVGGGARWWATEILTPMSLSLERVDLASGGRESQIVCFSQQEVAQKRRIQQRKFCVLIRQHVRRGVSACLPSLRYRGPMQAELAPVHCISECKGHGCIRGRHALFANICQQPIVTGVAKPFVRQKFKALLGGIGQWNALKDCAVEIPKSRRGLCLVSK